MRGERKKDSSKKPCPVRDTEPSSLIDNTVDEDYAFRVSQECL